MLFDIPLDSVDESHLQSLVNSVPEGRQIEYKQHLPGNSYDEVVEFLKDASAMANAYGGDILYGVREGKDAGGNTVAVAVDGVAGEDADKVKLRLENVIRDNVRPRLIGYRVEPISLANGNRVFILRVPRSWNAPHVVEYQRHWRFYYRNSAGSHPMDVTELRHAFTFADTLAQRLEEFRLERLAKIASDMTVGDGPKVVLHIQPFSSVDPTAHVDFLRAKSIDHHAFLHGNGGAFTRRPNYHGFFEYVDRGGRRNYLQIFRTGKLEAVSGDLISTGDIRQPGFEENLLSSTYSYLRLMKELGVAAPLLLHLSLLGVKGYTVGSGSFIAGARPEWTKIDEDDLLLPGELIESYNEAPPRILKNSFDAVWNAAGSERSPYYDKDNNWRAQ